MISLKGLTIYTPKVRHLKVTENCRHQIVYQMWLIQIKGASLIHVVENVLIICILLNTIQKTQPKKCRKKNSLGDSSRNLALEWRRCFPAPRGLIPGTEASVRLGMGCEIWVTRGRCRWVQLKVDLKHRKTLRLLSPGARLAVWEQGLCWTFPFPGISHQREAALYTSASRGSAVGSQTPAPPSQDSSPHRQPHHGHTRHGCVRLSKADLDRSHSCPSPMPSHKTSRPHMPPPRGRRRSLASGDLWKMAEPTSSTGTSASEAKYEF